MSERVQVRQERRKSLAMRATPEGVVVLVPRYVDPESAEVRAFVEEGLGKLSRPDPVPADQGLDEAGLRALVADWAARLGVTVARVQVRRMRRKWGSMSTRGTLTLARDVTRLPRALAEYVVVHELLHLRVAGHGGLYEVLLARYLPDWRALERDLGRWVVLTGGAAREAGEDGIAVRRGRQGADGNETEGRTD